VKLYVEHTGWYRVTLANLAAEGLDRQAPGSSQLYLTDRRTLLVKDGGIEFYGQGIDSPYHGYQRLLAVKGRDRQRIQQSGEYRTGDTGLLRPHGDPHERSIYFAALRNGDTENFFARSSGGACGENASGYPLGRGDARSRSRSRGDDTGARGQRRFNGQVWEVLPSRTGTRSRLLRDPGGNPYRRRHIPSPSRHRVSSM